MHCICLFQVEEDPNNACVKFTPSQYRMNIYYSRLPLNKSADELNAICWLQKRTVSWQNTNNLTA